MTKTMNNHDTLSQTVNPELRALIAEATSRGLAVTVQSYPLDWRVAPTELARFTPEHLLGIEEDDCDLVAKAYEGRDVSELTSRTADGDKFVDEHTADFDRLNILVSAESPLDTMDWNDR